MEDINPHEKWSTGQLDDLAQSLERDFASGVAIDETESGTLRIALEHAVGRMGNLKFEIFSREHPPPHFRVSYKGETANYSIRDCSKLNGGLSVYEKNIHIWYKNNRNEIIKKWNNTRPSDCPVGEYVD